MINEERFWEASIAEAVSEKAPPDVTGKVLTALATKEEEAPKKRGRLKVLRWGLELAAAAAVVLGIGLATGIIKLPGGDEGDEVLPPQQVAAAPGAKYEYKDGIIELKSGWLLVTTGAPTVVCEGSELSKVDGRVLIHAGSMPPGERPESVANWLNANNVETDMVNNIKHWVKGVGLAALVLSGTAMLDGQEIKAPEPQPQSTAEWHVIRSVMDIDNLPKGARFVSADGINAAHLDFLAEVESLEGIRMVNCEELRAEHLVSLKELPNLRILDIRNAEWSQVPDLSPLVELKSLNRLGADLVPASWSDDGSYYRRHGERVYRQSGKDRIYSDYDYLQESVPTLKQLAERGVEIDLGEFDPSTQDKLQAVLTALPTTRSMRIYSPSVGEMKTLSTHKKLRSIDIIDYVEGQIGLAYLARSAELEELSISGDGITIDEIHQISRMPALRFLRLNAYIASSPEQCFSKISSMTGLKELELAGLRLDDEALPAFKVFADREPFDRVRLEYGVLDGEYQGAELMLAQHIPTRRLELASGDIPYWVTKREPEPERKDDDGTAFIEIDNVLPPVLLDGAAAKFLEVVHFDLIDTEFETDYIRDAHADVYRTFPNLKRVEIRRGGFDSPAGEDQFVRWLKKQLPKVEIVVTP